MELKDIVSSSLRKDMSELRQLQERKKEIKKEYGIEERIVARAHLEKELMIKERDVKQGWEYEKRLTEFEMQKQDTMIQKSKCSSLRENMNASESDNNVAGAFHDKDNITEVQSSDKEMVENVFAHDNDQKHAAEKTKMDNQTLKEENVLLKK
ncbi:hypothetical protein Tco_1086708 [Tanacetum coccineum]